MRLCYTKNYWESVCLNNGVHMCNKIRTEVEAYLAQYPPALSLFRKIMKVGDVYIVDRRRNACTGTDEYAVRHREWQGICA